MAHSGRSVTVYSSTKRYALRMWRGCGADVAQIAVGQSGFRGHRRPGRGGLRHTRHIPPVFTPGGMWRLCAAQPIPATARPRAEGDCATFECGAECGAMRRTIPATGTGIAAASLG